MDRSNQNLAIPWVGRNLWLDPVTGARYVSVITLTGIDTLIPNEELDRHRVENWSFQRQTQSACGVPVWHFRTFRPARPWN